MDFFKKTEIFIFSCSNLHQFVEHYETGKDEEPIWKENEI